MDTNNLPDNSINVDDFIKIKKETAPPDGTPKKLILCNHEIVFNITAHVLEENLKGEIVGSKEICAKDYHIPVPFDKDYHNYMNIFFNRLEECIIHGVDNANEISKDKNNE